MNTKKIKVVFFINTFLLGGIEKVLIEYLDKLDKDIFEPYLLIGLNMGEAQVLFDQIPKDIPYKYLVKYKIINYFKIKKIITRKKLNIFEKVIEALVFTPIHRVIYSANLKKQLALHDVLVDFGFSYKIPQLPIPIISYLHFSVQSYLKWEQSKDSKCYQFLAKQLSMRDVVVTLNEDMKRELQSYFPTEVNKFEVIYNPFNLEKLKQLADVPLDVVGKFGNYGYILTVCRLNETQKDITCLINAFALLVNNSSYRGKLVIVGDGPSLNVLSELVRTLKLTNLVIFEGFKENTLNYMKHADVFVLSSKYEGLPGVLIEAISVGVPVISSDCPTGPKEILKSGQAGGLLFKIGNAEQLSQILNEVLFNHELKAQLVKSGLSRSLDFSSEHNVDKLEKILLRSYYEKN